MNRYLVIPGLALALLAGCVRGNGDDVRSEAPRRLAASDQASFHQAEEAAPPPAPTNTGSRLLPSAESLSDPMITARIRAGMLADPLLRGVDVSVNTTQGVVTLTGTVISQEQAALVSAHAQRQDGVMRVDNHLSANLQ